MYKHKKLSARILSLALTVAMVGTMLPATVFAAEGDTSIGASSITECHPEHDKDCGYIKAVEGMPCSHLNEEDVTYSCTPIENADNEASPSEAKKEYACDHMDGCGYAEAVEGAPCTHNCEICETVKDSGNAPANDKQEQVACGDITASNALLDKLLGLLKDQQKMIDEGGADVIATDEFNKLAAEIDVLYSHVNVCETCAAQMDEDGAYYEKFYGVQTLEPTPSPTIEQIDRSSCIMANGAALVIEDDNGGTTVYIDANVNGEKDVNEKSLHDAGVENAPENGADLSFWLVYGGSNSTALTGDTHITMNSGKIGNIYGGSNEGTLTGDTHVTMNGGELYNVYGGGISPTIVGNTNLTINDGIIKFDAANLNSAGGGRISGTATFTINGGSIKSAYLTDSNDSSVGNAKLKIIGGMITQVIATDKNIGGTKAFVITGGSISKQYVNSNVTNVLPQNGNGEFVYKTGIALSEAAEGTEVTGLTGVADYGMNGIKTDSAGKIYVWLPENSVITAASTADHNYKGTVTTTSDSTAAATFTATTAENNSTITPTTATFDKYTSAADYTDVSVTQTLNGNTLTAIKNGSTALTSGTDYSVSDNTITIKKEYLAQQNTETTTLTFDYSAGTDPTLAITVSDSTPATTHTITASAGTGGSISPSGTVTVNNGESKTFTISANSNYSISSVSVDGVNQGAISTYTFSNVTGNHTISATFSYNGGGSGGSSSGGGGGSSSTTTPTKPTEPVTGSSNTNATTDSKGNVTANVTTDNISDAVKAAKDAATKKGVNAGEVTAVINVTSPANSNPNTVTVNLPKTVQDQIISNKVGNVAIVIDKPDISIGMTLATITEMNKQANADIQLSATRTDATKLSTEAKNAIGSRPAFDLKATYASGAKSVTNFGSGTVSVAIPYTLQNGEVAGGLYAVYVDGNGKVNYITNSSYDADAKMLRFSTNHFSVYGISYKAPVGFTDIANHWAKTDIEFVANRGLMSGTSNTTFAPDSAMTRGMFVTALGRLSGVDVSSYKTGKFTDVKTDAYYAPYVNWAADKGIVKGTSDTTFAPDQSISRQEMAVMMSNYASVLGYKVPETRDAVTFADNASIGSWAAPAVKQMQMAGILNGKNGNKFDPTGTATRGEISAMLHRYVELVIDRTTTEGWTTNDSGSSLYYQSGKAVTGAKTISNVAYNFNGYGEATR